VKKNQSFVESISEEILALTGPDDVEQEILDSDEYSLTIDTKASLPNKFKTRSPV
jgi:hypothetical protein